MILLGFYCALNAFILFLIVIGFLTFYEEILHKKHIIHYFSSGQVKKYNRVGYAYLDNYDVLHITYDKTRCLGHYVVTTLPYKGGYPIDKKGNPIVIMCTRETNYCIYEKYGRIIPKVLKNLYIKCKEC